MLAEARGRRAVEAAVREGEAVAVRPARARRGLAAAADDVDVEGGAEGGRRAVGAASGGEQPRVVAGKEEGAAHIAARGGEVEQLADGGGASDECRTVRERRG